MTARSHTRSRKRANRRRRVAWLKHLGEGGRRKGAAKRRSAVRRKEEIDRTVQVLNEKGTDR